MGQIAIGLLSGSKALRGALRSFLDSEPGFRVEAEADNGAGMANMVRDRSPDVLVIDTQLDGPSCVLQLRDVSGGVGLVALSLFNNPSVVLAWLAAGVNAFVVKGSSSEELVSGIRHADMGLTYVDSSISRQELSCYAARAGMAGEGHHALLTPRQREILRLVSQGWDEERIACRLGISERSVKAHRRNIAARLSSTQADLP